MVSCIEGEPGPVRYAGSWVAALDPPPGRLDVGMGYGRASPIAAPAPSVRGSPRPPWISRDPRPTLSWPRSVLFNPDGCCLYSGCQDSLRVYGWEPERCFDVVLVSWGKVADLAVCNDQLVREPPPALPLAAHRLPLRPHFPPPSPGVLPTYTPPLPLPADRRGLLPEQRLLLCGGPDAGHQDRHGGPGPRAGQPAPGAAASPPQCPSSAHL